MNECGAASLATTDNAPRKGGLSSPLESNMSAQFVEQFCGCNIEVDSAPLSASAGLGCIFTWSHADVDGPDDPRQGWGFTLDSVKTDILEVCGN